MTAIERPWRRDRVLAAAGFDKEYRFDTGEGELASGRLSPEVLKPVTFIDWSDAEGMFGLLLDFVADERAECEEDPERQRFLSDLLAQLRALEARLAGFSASVVVQGLRDASESTGPEFVGDPVMAHLRGCIEELERVD